MGNQLDSGGDKHCILLIGHTHFINSVINEIKMDSFKFYMSAYCMLDIER